MSRQIKYDHAGTDQAPRADHEKEVTRLGVANGEHGHGHPHHDSHNRHHIATYFEDR